MRSARLFLPTILAATISCGDDTMSNAGSGGDDASSTAPTSTTASTGAGAGGEAPATTGVGFVTYSHYRAVEFDGFALTFSARFYSEPRTDCSSETFGSCVVSDCSASSEGVAALAGSIRLDETVLDVLSFPENGRYFYSGDLSELPIIQEGASLGLEALGQDVPAFDATIAMPPRPTFTSPVETEGRLEVSRDGFDVTWDAHGASGEAVVMAADGDLYLDCRAPLDAGRLIVPAEALERYTTPLPLLLLSARTEAEQVVGDYLLELSGEEGDVHYDVALE